MSAGSLDRFDNSARILESLKFQRTLRAVFLPLAALLIVIGILLLLVFPLGAPSPTIGDRFVPLLLIILGATSGGIVAIFSPKGVAAVIVSDEDLTVLLTSGRSIEQRWDDPALAVKLWPVARGRRTTVGDPPDRLLAWKGLAGAMVSPEIAEAIIGRARGLGLGVVTDEGKTSSLAVTTISRTSAVAEAMPAGSPTGGNPDSPATSGPKAPAGDPTAAVPFRLRRDDRVVAPRVHVTVECHDPGRMTQFWSSALGYALKPPPDGYSSWDDYWRRSGIPWDEVSRSPELVIDPTGGGPRIWIQPMDGPSPGKNRIHFGRGVGGGRTAPLEVRRDRVEAEATRLANLGATRVRVVQSEGVDHYAVTMADPEGNEFDIS